MKYGDYLNECKAIAKEKDLSFIQKIKKMWSCWLFFIGMNVMERR